MSCEALATLASSLRVSTCSVTFGEFTKPSFGEKLDPALLKFSFALSLNTLSNSKANTLL